MGRRQEYDATTKMIGVLLWMAGVSGTPDILEGGGNLTKKKRKRGATIGKPRPPPMNWGGYIYSNMSRWAYLL